MDFLKKGQEMMKGSGSGSSAPKPAEGQAGSAQQKDYGDKALDFIQQKTGHKMGDSTNEKITDGARGFYEKQSGSKIDPKYSN